MRVFVDTRPLHESPDFRRLWATTALSNTGTQLTIFAVSLQVYQLTGSSVAVGAVGLAAAGPAVLFGLLGGSIVDAVDRRRLVLCCSLFQAALSGLLAAQAFAHLDKLWPLYALVAGQSLSGAVNGPARRTFLARLLPPQLLPAGAAINMVAFHASVIGGPALAGLLTAVWGLRVCYLLDALSYAAALYGVARLPAMRPEGGPARPGLRAVGEGLRFIGRTKVLLGAFLADLNSTVLGMPVALFPAINAGHFGGRAQTLGLLFAAPGVGGLLGAVLSGPVGHVSRQGRAQLIAGAVWGAGLVGFGLAPQLWLAVPMLALAGGADAVNVVFRTAMVQVATPDRYRGRVSATEYVVGACCPQLGNFRAGALGSLTTPAASAVTGGVSVIVGAAVLGLALPAFSRYEAATVDGPPATLAGPADLERAVAPTADPAG